MEFEWDNNKNLANALKHGICFEHVQGAFDDPDQLLIEDKKHSTYEEKRFWLIGHVADQLILAVFTYRRQHIRLISTRPANQKERNWYEQGSLTP
jgi:uncharacterized protein